MSDIVGNPEDRFSGLLAHLEQTLCSGLIIHLLECSIRAVS